MNIVAKNCLLMRVAHHKHNYNGTICSQAAQWRCGSSDTFRQNCCAQGKTYCSDMFLFEATDPHVRKRADHFDGDGYLSDLDQLVQEGGNPIVFFYTSPQPGLNLLTGLYVAGEVHHDDYAGTPEEFQVRPQPGFAVRFDDPTLTNEFLWRHSYGLGGCRYVSESYVPTALAEVLRRQQELLTEAARRPSGDGAAANLEANVGVLQKIIQLLGQTAGEASAAAAVPAGAAGAGALATEAGTGRVATDAGIGGAQVGASGATAAAEDGQVAAAVLGPEGSAVLRQPAALTHPPLVQELSGVLQRVREHTRGLGLYYPDDLLKRYHVSLLTKPFVILAGIAGGGKTQLAMSYAEANDAALKVISVGPNWTSNEALLGAYDVLSRTYVPSEFTEFLVEAGQEYQRAQESRRAPRKYMVVLDEMNLSHVEYYFSDFLSKMELPAHRRRIRLHGYEGSAYPMEVAVPPNFCITGTVNVDETTHRFSPKVLDRANFIRLDEINLQAMVDLIDQWEPAIFHKEQARAAAAQLRALNTVLASAWQHFGYRTAREILTWVDQATAAGAFSFAEALDIQIVQKVLVKVQGSRYNPTERKMIQELAVLLEDITDPATQEPLFPRATAQVHRMARLLDEEEFAFGQG